MCARALAHALNDAKTHAQQGCAMQFSGITLITRMLQRTLCRGAKSATADPSVLQPGSLPIKTVNISRAEVISAIIKFSTSDNAILAF